MGSDTETVELSVTVDVDGASADQLEMFHQLATLYEEAFTTLVSKNIDYGSSFLKQAESRAQKDEYPFDGTRAVLDGLYTRTGDKRDRIHRIAFSDEETRLGDITDDLLDSMNYHALGAWAVEHYSEPSCVDADVDERELAIAYHEMDASRFAGVPHPDQTTMREHLEQIDPTETPYGTTD